MKRKLIEKTTPPKIGDSSITEGTTISFKSVSGDDTKLTGIVNEVFNDEFGNTFYKVNEATTDDGNIRNNNTVDSKNIIGII